MILITNLFIILHKGYYLTNVYSFNFLITILSLTIFAFETKDSSRRISSTFTLILTSVSFKLVTGRMLPTISYMTSLDRYQIVNIFYLVMCCVWNAIIASLKIDMSIKIKCDSVAMGIFCTSFILIQVSFATSLYMAFTKVKELKKREIQFIIDRAHCDNDYDDDDDFDQF
jgi:hypothetical protein